MKYYLQDSRQYVGNCMLWWRKGAEGYTTDLAEAMVIEEHELLLYTRDTDIPWPKDYIDAAAAQHVDHQRVDRAQAAAFVKAREAPHG